MLSFLIAGCLQKLKICRKEEHKLTTNETTQCNFYAKEICTHSIVLKQLCSTCYNVSGPVHFNFRCTFQECIMKHVT